MDKTASSLEKMAWLEECLGKEASDLIFSSREETKRWTERIRFNCEKADEYGRVVAEIPEILEELQKRADSKMNYYKELPTSEFYDGIGAGFQEAVEIFRDKTSQLMTAEKPPKDLEQEDMER